MCARESAAVISESATHTTYQHSPLPVDRKAALTAVTKIATCHALSSMFPSIGARVCTVGVQQ
jgi:hypothetical protein